MTTAHIPMSWTGEAFEPVARFRKLCDEEFVVGQHYRVTAEEERSEASHGHYFVVLGKAFSTLPDDAAERFPTEDHLRAYCLIKAGFCDITTTPLGSKADALRVVALVKTLDPFALAVPRDNVVTIYRAQSQSYKAMGKERFQASKTAVLDILADMLGVEPAALASAA